VSTPPRWDLTPIFPGLDSPEFREACVRLRREADGLSALLDERSTPRRSPAVDDAAVADLEEIVGAYEALLEISWTIESYLMALVDINSNDQTALAAQRALSGSLGGVCLLGRRFAAWLAALDLDALIDRSSVAQERKLSLRRLREQASHAMGAELEDLAGELHALAGAGWATLRAQVIAGIQADVEIDGSVERVQLSSLRAAATDPDRTIRQRAHLAEVAAYGAHAVPLTAALNGVAGERSVLARRRGWTTPLDEALFNQGIDRAILDALVTATREALPDLRRYPLAKAAALKVERLAWLDLSAPVGSQRRWTFDQAAHLVISAFAGFSPTLGDLSERASAERWIDAEPRAGKQGGGLCYMLPNGRSVIRVEFHGSYDGVRMLAHELGHAYHGAVLARADRPMLQIDAAPAPLMETASKLCEEFVRQEAVAAARRSADVHGELDLLDGFLAGARRSVVDALTNFLFEEQLLARRAKRELGSDEINGLMNDVRLEVNGDVLDPDYPFPWTWAAQPHLYLDGQPFYNLPYLFGQLLALGLCAQLEAEPAGFPERLDEFLAAVGRRPPSVVVQSFGVDLASPAFWASGLSMIGRQIDRFEFAIDTSMSS